MNRPGTGGGVRTITANGNGHIKRHSLEAAVELTDPMIPRHLWPSTEESVLWVEETRMYDRWVRWHSVTHPQPRWHAVVYFRILGQIKTKTSYQ